MTSKTRNKIIARLSVRTDKGGIRIAQARQGCIGVHTVEHKGKPMLHRWKNRLTYEEYWRLWELLEKLVGKQSF